MIRYISTVSPARLKGVALLRLDFNTADEWRLVASLPTVKFLARRADKLIIVSHRGRPDGRNDKNLSLRKDAALLSKRLGRQVIFVPHFRFSELDAMIRRARRGSVFLLENIRFLKGEDKNDPKLGKYLAGLADYYVNDSFATNHRAAASLVAVTDFLPSYAGMGLEKEIKFLSRVMQKPRKPLVLIIGGAKTYDKLGVIKKFRTESKFILVGGGSANTLLSLRGVDVGKSKVEEDKKVLMILKAMIKDHKIILPVDWKTSGGKILDIGPKTEKLFAKHISSAGTIIWSGPMGVIERRKFEHGNLAVAQAVTKNKKAFSLTGGGETVSFLKKHKLDKKFSFISTGGGAFLEFLAGEKLPGIQALTGRKKRK